MNLRFIDGTEIGAIKEFNIPPELYSGGTIVITFDVPHEPGVNWRRVSRLSEVWLLNQSTLQANENQGG